MESAESAEFSSQEPVADDHASKPPVGYTLEALAHARFARLQAQWAMGRVPRGIEDRYEAIRTAFQEENGKINHEYWTRSDAGGVVVTIMGWYSKLPWRRHYVARFHRFTDYVTPKFSEADELLYAGDALAAISQEVLRGPTQRIALTQIYVAASQLISSLDALTQAERADNEPTERSASERGDRRRRAAEGYRRSLARAERFYRDGAEQSAQFFYFKGMLGGALLVSVLVFGFTQLLPVLASRWGLDLSKEDTAAGFAAAVAGALGACVSVMWRMTAGTFREGAVFGADNLMRLGAFRPFLGSMFGLILYVALKAGMISHSYIPQKPGWYFYIFLAFLAGFSERLVPDFLGDNERGFARRRRGYARGGDPVMGGRPPDDGNPSPTEAGADGDLFITP